MSSEHPALVATPGQTIGPFFGYALPVAGGEELVPASHPGAVRLRGTVYDGQGDPVPDALLEIWQADADGRAAVGDVTATFALQVYLPDADATVALAASRGAAVQRAVEE